MRLSKLFFTSLRDNPADAEMASHRLLVRAGYVRQLGSGIYSLLPLGFRVTRNVEQVIREEMDGIGGQEMEMPVVHPADLWRESVIVALFAQEIARLKRRNVESAYLCGLLHRAGMAVILGRIGEAALRHGVEPQPGQVLEIASRHETRVGTQLSVAWSLPPAVAAAISHWRDPPAAEMARAEVMEVALARQISAELRTPGIGGELPDTLLGPVSVWMDELSIYPDELFSIMAQRAAICATAESYT